MIGVKQTEMSGIREKSLIPDEQYVVGYKLWLLMMIVFQAESLRFCGVL